MRMRMEQLLEDKLGLTEETVQQMEGMTSARIAKLLRERGQTE